MDIRNCNGIELLKSLDDKSVDLILTDPPYIISHETGMNKLRDAIDSGKDISKTEREWEEYKSKNKVVAPNAKENYLKYGTIHGTKYSVKTDYGDWDKNFTMDVGRTQGPAAAIHRGEDAACTVPLRQGWRSHMEIKIRFNH